MNTPLALISTDQLQPAEAVLIFIIILLILVLGGSLYNLTKGRRK